MSDLDRSGKILALSVAEIRSGDFTRISAEAVDRITAHLYDRITAHLYALAYNMSANAGGGVVLVSPREILERLAGSFPDAESWPDVFGTIVGALAELNADDGARCFCGRPLPPGATRCERCDSDAEDARDHDDPNLDDDPEEED